MENFNNQLIRASSVGLIMTNGTDKKTMGETAKSYLKELFRERKYGIRKEITSKYIEKGLEVEDKAISFYSDYKGGFYIKNDEWFKNEFISGTPDIIDDELVIDIKSSWNLFTLPFKDDSINKGYFYQLQSYMALTGHEKAILAYVLIDTPSQLVEDEKKRLSWKMGLIDDIDETYLAACAEIDKSHDFSHIPKKDRVVEFEILRDDKVIEAIYQRVKECRIYLNQLNGN